VFDSVAGVEPQSETVWRPADKYRVPRICFVNKMTASARLQRTFDQIITKLEANPVASSSRSARKTSSRVVDLIKMKAITYKTKRWRRLHRARSGRMLERRSSTASS